MFAGGSRLELSTGTSIRAIEITEVVSSVIDAVRDSPCSYRRQLSQVTPQGQRVRSASSDNNRYGRGGLGFTMEARASCTRRIEAPLYFDAVEVLEVAYSSDTTMSSLLGSRKTTESRNGRSSC